MKGRKEIAVILGDWRQDARAGQEAIGLEFIGHGPKWRGAQAEGKKDALH